MSIPYTYKIINVNPQARAMEIVYTSPGRQTMHIGTRMPYASETPESIVRMYEPVAYWLEQEAQLAEVQDGLEGSIVPPESAPLTLETAKAAKLAEIAAWRYSLETSGVAFNGARIKTDRESQATVTSAFISLAQGLVTSIDWKAENGVWVRLGLAEMSAIAQAVAVHVQQSFTLEKSYVEQVAAASTIEAVQAIELPRITNMSAM